MPIFLYPGLFGIRMRNLKCGDRVFVWIGENCNRATIIGGPVLLGNQWTHWVRMDEDAGDMMENQHEMYSGLDVLVQRIQKIQRERTRELRV